MAKKQLSFLEQIKEKFSHLLITDDEEHEITAISTGSVSLDYSTGVGGIPRARFTEIYGPESSGKTTLCLSIARECIKGTGRVLYIDAENGLDFTRIRQIVGEYEDGQFILLQPQYAEETFGIAEEGIVNGDFDLIVLDSIAVLSLKADSFGEKEFEDNSKVSGMAGLISKFIKRNTYAIRNSNIAFVFVNQVRDVMNSYIPMVEAPGGHSIKHICSLRIFLQAGMGKDSRITVDDEIIGNYIKFVIKKNKVGRPLKTYSFPLMFDTGIDYFKDLVVFADILGVIERAGAYYRFEGINLGQGLEKTMEYLREDKNTLDKIKEVVYNKMNRETIEYKKETINE